MAVKKYLPLATCMYWSDNVGPILLSRRSILIGLFQTNTRQLLQWLDCANCNAADRMTSAHALSRFVFQLISTLFAQKCRQ